MKSAILFDLDGTLWDSSEQVTLAWNQVLATLPGPIRLMTTARLRGYMGKTVQEIASDFFCDLPLEDALCVMEQMCIRELALLKVTGAYLYPALRETIRALAKDYTLAIVSNCESGYIELFLEYSGLADCVADHTCSGDTGRDKASNISLLLTRNHIERAFYLGDTLTDQISAHKTGLPFVHARYGFGTPVSPAWSIDALSELIALAPTVLSAQFDE